MKFDKFIKEYLPEFNQLNEEEVNEITNFTLMWSLLESIVLDCRATPEKIDSNARSLVANGALDINLIADSLQYFKTRYFNKDLNALTPYYDGLKIEHRLPKYRDLILKMFTDDDINAQEKISALLLIIYRLRNNLFHGEKWAYGINGQSENFTHASKVIANVIKAKLSQ
jgi:hypothetical protein